MKIPPFISTGLACCGLASAQTSGSYTNFIRQVQLPSGVQWDASVASSGERVSALPVDIGGARFELWTVKSTPLTNYLLDTRFVSAYAPNAEVKLRSEDPYLLVPRTRADRPFFVDITVTGLLAGSGDPEGAKAAKLLRHVQSYGAAKTGENLDRSLATLVTQSVVSQNGTQTLSYSLTSVPSADRTKACGEERFSIFSIADENAPESQIASKYIQIWPVADGTISGITQNQRIRHQLPQVTLTLNDLYPQSYTYTQVYEGEPQLGKQGIIVPSSELTWSSSSPTSRVLILKGYDAVFSCDGRWTMELLTQTPFGIDRLAFVTFEIDRTIEMQGTFTTME